jgi:5-methyltetrahydrofolate--homocysteine methyltransferase
MAAVNATSPAQRWHDLLSAPGVVLADGAMGTMLFEAGLEQGEPPEEWNLTHAGAVRRVHRAYLEAGARIVLTNTFGGSRFRLALSGMEDRAVEFNRAAAELLRAEADAAGGQALVAGDIGPSGLILEPLGTLGFDEAVAGFAEQAAALVAGGVDILWIETMFDLEEVRAAIAGARSAAPGVPIVATMTFDTRGHTMMGVAPEAAAAALLAMGADAIGANCGNGPDEILPVIVAMRAAAPDAVLVAKSNVGMPTLIDGRAVYDTGPAEMARRALEMRAAGADIVGGCCGSTPAHLRQMAAALSTAG